MANEINYKLLQEMINCVKREVAMRYKVYPKWIRDRITEQTIEKEKALMYWVQKALQKIYDGTHLNLFNNNLLMHKII